MLLDDVFTAPQPKTQQSPTLFLSLYKDGTAPCWPAHTLIAAPSMSFLLAAFFSLFQREQRETRPSMASALSTFRPTGPHNTLRMVCVVVVCADSGGGGG